MDETLKNYSWLMNLLLIALCAWLLAGPITLLIQQFFEADFAPSPVVRAQSEPQTLAQTANGKQSILDRNLFNLQLNSNIDELPIPSTHGQQAVKTNLKLTLVGTLVTPDPLTSIATIGGKGKSIERRFHVGEKIEKKHEIQKIVRGRIEFYNQDKRQLEFLEFDKSKPRPIPRRSRETWGLTARTKPTKIQQSGANNFTIPKKQLDDALENLDQIITQARAIPNTVNGKIEGFRIFAIQPGSIYSQLGIRNGDVLREVNGKPINTVQSALILFETLKSQKNFKIKIDRRGKPEIMNYNVI